MHTKQRQLSVSKLSLVCFPQTLRPYTKTPSPKLGSYRTKSKSSRTKYQELINTWQDRWSTSPKAPWTHKLIPNIVNRLKIPIWTNHHLSQFLTEHGNFRAKLHSFGLADSPLCGCGAQEETAEHVLFLCSLASQHRTLLISQIQLSGHPWPCELHILYFLPKQYTVYSINFQRLH